MLVAYCWRALVICKTLHTGLYVHNFIYSSLQLCKKVVALPYFTNEKNRTQVNWELSLSHTVVWPGIEHTRLPLSRAHVPPDSLVLMTHLFSLKKAFAYRMEPLKPGVCGQPNRLNHSIPEGCYFLITECNCTSVPQGVPRLRGGCL